MAKKASLRVPVRITKPLEAIILDHLEMNKLELEKIKESPALNGGFSALEIAVSNIGEDVKETKTKVDAVHEAVYEPDTGLYARVKEMLPAKEFRAVEVDVNELKVLRAADEKVKAEIITDTKAHAKIVNDHANELIDLRNFKTNVYAAAKWLAIALAGSGITVAAKLLYEAFQGSIKLIH